MAWNFARYPAVIRSMAVAGGRDALGATIGLAGARIG
jgi:hypothetical protein